MFRLPAVVVAILLCGGCSTQVTAPSRDIAALADAGAIYGKFLDDWTGKEKDPINVSISAKALSGEELEEFSDCLAKSSNAKWSPAEPIPDLTSSLRNISYVRLVDPDKWESQDPSDLMAQGKSVESAVDEGFASGLLTLSAIAFDSNRETAAFTYSFVCGGLCGHGGTVTFKKVQGQWARSENQCGSWISQIQRGRSNNSFKPNPLRGSA